MQLNQESTTGTPHFKYLHFQFCNSQYHVYADESQRYTSFMPSLSEAKTCKMINITLYLKRA